MKERGEIYMFKWKDYEDNTALFIDGISENVAILRYKDFQLTDAATGLKVKMKSSNIDEAKVDAENFLKKLNMLNYDIGSNIGFIADQFNEQMDKTIMEAKGEIESFCQNKINAIANASLVEHREEFLKLENPVQIEE